MRVQQGSAQSHSWAPFDDLDAGLEFDALDGLCNCFLSFNRRHVFAAALTSLNAISNDRFVPD
jgi:hypothetical protein